MKDLSKIFDRVLNTPLIYLFIKTQENENLQKLFQALRIIFGESLEQVRIYVVTNMMFKAILMIQGLSESLTTKTVKDSFLFLKSAFPFYIVLRKALRILHLLHFSAVFFFVFFFHFFGFAFSFYCLFFSISLPLIRFSQVISIDGWLDFQQQAWVGMMNISEITVPRAFWQALAQQVFKEIVFICFESPIFILSFSP